VHKKTADHSSEWKVRFSAAAWTCWSLHTNHYAMLPPSGYC